MNELFVIEHISEKVYFRGWHIAGVSINIVPVVGMAKTYESEDEADNDFKRLMQKSRWRICPVSEVSHG